MKEPDWERVRVAVEAVISKHERIIECERRRELRRKCREISKQWAFVNAALTGWRIAAQLGFGFLSGRISREYTFSTLTKIRNTPAKVFCINKPAVSPRRAKALQRARNWGREVQECVVHINLAEGERNG